MTMRQTLETIASLMGADVEWVTDPQRLRPGKSEVFRLLGSNEKIRRLTGWQPEVTLEEGLRRTIEWFCNDDNLRKYKPEIYNQ